MFTKKLIAAALFALAPFAAHAALTTISPTGWPPVPSSGLESVMFNKVDLGNGAFVAMGAHAYKNGAFLPNDGTSTFFARNGVYAPDGKSYANWSFDFSYNTGDCTSCKVWLEVDKDPSAGKNYVQLFDLTTLPGYGNLAGQDSWNMEMGFMTSMVYNFNPYAPSSTMFRLSLVNGQNFAGVRSDASEITVNVPEPGSMALAGLALAGLALARRRKS